MSTISRAYRSRSDDKISQGDIFKNVRYNYIESDNEEEVHIIEYEFPLAVIISQACDVIAMEDTLIQKEGKPAKFMPSILMCPIYEKESANSGQHLVDAYRELSIQLVNEKTFQKEDLQVSKRDWHYRIHYLEIEVDGQKVIRDAIVDFKHYFTVPMSYLVNHKSDRILHLDDLFAEQLTLKYATYLTRVAIP